MKILIIEDNTVSRMLLAKILSHHGVEVLEAENGKRGIEIAKSKMPNLILLDLQLPEMDGYTVAKILCEDQKTADIPVVAVSANVRDVDKNDAINAGCVGFIEKPLNTRTFYESLKQYLN